MTIKIEAAARLKAAPVLTPLQEGVSAGLNGLPKVCPYKYGTMEQIYWCKGWEGGHDNFLTDSGY